VFFHQIRPFVRFARLYRPSPANCGHFAAMRDCRLFFLHEGKAVICVGENEYNLDLGCCLYIPSGTPYCLKESTGSRPEFYIINFDFTWDHSTITHTMPAVKPGEDVDFFSVPSLEDSPYFNHELFFSKMHHLEPMLQALESEEISPRLFSPVRQSAQMVSILTELARTQLSDHPAHPDAVEAMIQYIRTNYMFPLRNETIAEQVNYHPNYANQLFLKHTGHTLRQYLIDCRIQRALELLLSTELSITDISAQAGFSSLSRFTKEFTAKTGYPPSRYRSRAE